MACLFQTIWNDLPIIVRRCWSTFVSMNQGKYIFSQVMSFLDPNDFRKCVTKYAGHYKVHHFRAGTN